MNKILNRIEKRLKEKEIKYTVNNHTIYFKVRVDGIVGTVNTAIKVEKDCYITFALLNNKVPLEYISSVSEYLHMANEGLIRGNFEFDLINGSVRYKLTTDFEDADTISNIQIDRSIIIPCTMMRKYGEGIIKLSVGTGTPKELIKEIETINDSE